VDGTGIGRNKRERITNMSFTTFIRENKAEELRDDVIYLVKDILGKYLPDTKEDVAEDIANEVYDQIIKNIIRNLGSK
jgi:hypothetical protein